MVLILQQILYLWLFLPDKTTPELVFKKSSLIKKVALVFINRVKFCPVLQCRVSHYERNVVWVDWKFLGCTCRKDLSDCWLGVLVRNVSLVLLLLTFESKIWTSNLFWLIDYMWGTWKMMITWICEIIEFTVLGTTDNPFSLFTHRHNLNWKQLETRYLVLFQCHWIVSFC